MGLGYIYDIIVSPVITEKTNLQATDNKFTFEVVASAKKTDIEKAVEEIFGVDVVKVNIVNTKGKTRKYKGKVGKKSDVRKAVVTMKKGQQIDLAKLEGK